MTSQVLSNLEQTRNRVPDRHRRRRHAELCGAPRQARREGHRHPEDDGQRRPQHRVLHRLFDRDHSRHDAIERQRTTVGSHERIGSVPRVRPRCRLHRRSTPPTSVRSAAAFPSTSSTLERLIDLLVTDKKDNPSNYSLCVLSEGCGVGRLRRPEYGEADAFGHRKKANVAEDLSDEIKKRTERGNDRQRSDLRTALAAIRISSTSWSPYLRQHGARRRATKASSGLMTAISNGCYRDGADSRSQARAPQGGHRDHVQHRALPPELRQQVRIPDLPDPRVNRFDTTCGGKCVRGSVCRF